MVNIDKVNKMLNEIQPQKEDTLMMASRIEITEMILNSIKNNTYVSNWFMNDLLNPSLLDYKVEVYTTDGDLEIFNSGKDEIIAIRRKPSGMKLTLYDLEDADKTWDLIVHMFNLIPETFIKIRVVINNLGFFYINNPIVLRGGS